MEFSTATFDYGRVSISKDLVGKPLTSEDAFVPCSGYRKSTTESASDPFHQWIIISYPFIPWVVLHHLTHSLLRALKRQKIWVFLAQVCVEPQTQSEIALEEEILQRQQSGPLVVRALGFTVWVPCWWGTRNHHLGLSLLKKCPPKMPQNRLFPHFPTKFLLLFFVF